MKAKPIIFSAPMIRALLEGRKSQTRRILKPQPEPEAFLRLSTAHDGVAIFRNQHTGLRQDVQLPYTPGHLLWVREVFAYGWPIPAGETQQCSSAEHAITCRADGHAPFGGGSWHSPIHMPRWASRLTLEVTEVRVQRVQDISEADAEAEGLTSITKDGKTWKWGVPDRDGLPGNDDHGWHWQEWDTDPRRAYATLWNRLHGPGAWERNDWVCALTFTAHHKNIDALLAERRAA